MIFVKMKGHLNCSKKLRGVIVKDISALNEYEYVSGERRRKAKQEDWGGKLPRENDDGID